MKKNKKMKYFITGVLILSLLLSVGVVAFADYGSGLQLKGSPGLNQVNAASKGGFKAALDSLVKEGKLSQAKADSILQYIQKKMEQRKALAPSPKTAPQTTPQRFNIIDELKSAGIITDAEATIITAKQKELCANKQKLDLNSLVQKGVLTQNDVTKINAYLATAKQEKQKMLNEIKGMTKEQMKTYFDTHKVDRTNIVQKMVNAGVITKEQAAEIQKRFHNAIIRAINGKNPKHQKVINEAIPHKCWLEHLTIPPL